MARKQTAQEDGGQAEEVSGKGGQKGQKDNYAKISTILKRLQSLCVTDKGGVYSSIPNIAFE